MNIEMRTTAQGKQVLVSAYTDTDGALVEDQIPLPMIASWRELLGIDDPVEVVEAIFHVFAHGEPDPDPVTSEHVWTEAYGLLQVREQAREDEAAKAREEGCTEGVVQERAEKAAYDAVHIPVNGGECALDRCRREARRKLGLPDPSRKCGPETRHTPPTIPGQDVADPVARAVGLLKDKTPELQECTRRFLHGLTDRETDPLEDRSDQ